MANPTNPNKSVLPGIYAPIHPVQWIPPSLNHCQNCAISSAVTTLVEVRPGLHFCSVPCAQQYEMLNAKYSIPPEPEPLRAPRMNMPKRYGTKWGKYE